MDSRYAKGFLVRCHLTCSWMAILLNLLDEAFAATELTVETRPVVHVNDQVVEDYCNYM